MDNYDEREITKKILDERVKKKDDFPALSIKKTWKVDWDTKLSGFFKKLFGG